MKYTLFIYFTRRHPAPIASPNGAEAHFFHFTAQTLAKRLVVFHIPAMADKTPSEIARDALKASALKEAPEPDAIRPLDGPGSLGAELHEHIACLVEFSMSALGEDDSKTVPDALALASFCRQNALHGALEPLRDKLAGFNKKLSLAADGQAHIRLSLLTMLRLVFENIPQLSTDDPWLQGQADLLMSASEPPLTLSKLDELERGLNEFIFKQSELKRRTMRAQEDMKRLLASFIEKLSLMAERSGATHDRIEACAKLIESAHDLASVGPALNEAIEAIRSLAASESKALDDLASMKRKADGSASEIARLNSELDSANSSSRHDPLTGALNRKGLDEAVAREVSRAKRQHSKLCFALLDIDNFKAINDLHGHTAGDAVLAHFADVAREASRPQDTLARYGGEEFVIVMPDTALDGALIAMTRLQLELARRFFAPGHEKLPVTFSAGVAELAPDEKPSSAIERADQGMYQAKRAGKNKVIAG